MSDPPVKIYVGCSLTQAPEAFTTAVETLKAQLKTDYEVFDFLGLVKGTPTDVYHWDIDHCIGECDLFVALCDYPAIGLGYEMGVAVEKLLKPVLALAHTNTHVSRMLSGIDAPHYTFERYNSLEDVPALIRQKLAS
jgi:hypothetical protein